MQTRRINAETVPVPTTGYAQAVEVSDHRRLLFVSGQTPVALDGSVPDGFEAQCRLVWRNIEAQLQAAGMTLDNLVLSRTYLADRAYALANRAIRNEIFAGREAAGATVVIAGIFDAAWLVEVEAVAAA